MLLPAGAVAEPDDPPEPLLVPAADEDRAPDPLDEEAPALEEPPPPEEPEPAAEDPTDEDTPDDAVGPLLLVPPVDAPADEDDDAPVPAYSAATSPAASARSWILTSSRAPWNVPKSNWL